MNSKKTGHFKISIARKFHISKNQPRKNCEFRWFSVIAYLIANRKYLYIKKKSTARKIRFADIRWNISTFITEFENQMWENYIFWHLLILKRLEFNWFRGIIMYLCNHSLSLTQTKTNKQKKEPEYFHKCDFCESENLFSRRKNYLKYVYHLNRQRLRF